MEKIDLVVKTAQGKEHYRIHQKEGRYQVYRNRRIFPGIRIATKMAESRTCTGAYEIIQLLTPGTILRSCS